MVYKAIGKYGKNPRGKREKGNFNENSHLEGNFQGEFSLCHFEPRKEN